MKEPPTPPAIKLTPAQLKFLSDASLASVYAVETYKPAIKLAAVGLIERSRDRWRITEKGKEYLAVDSSPTTLRIKLEGREYKVPRKAYAIKKTAQLKEFGYPSLTVDEVEAQIDALMNNKKLGDGLTVIGMFMEGEILSSADKH